MPFQVSPGVNVSEIDLTTIVPAVYPVHVPFGVLEQFSTFKVPVTAGVTLKVMFCSVSINHASADGSDCTSYGVITIVALCPSLSCVLLYANR